jgi:hypothetical protein
MAGRPLGACLGFGSGRRQVASHPIRDALVRLVRECREPSARENATSGLLNAPSGARALLRPPRPSEHRPSRTSLGPRWRIATLKARCRRALHNARPPPITAFDHRPFLHTARRGSSTRSGPDGTRVLRPCERPRTVSRDAAREIAPHPPADFPKKKSGSVGRDCPSENFSLYFGRL